MPIDAEKSSEQACGGRMRIILAGEFGFPNGSGRTARVYAFAKGLSAAGCDVEVACLRPTEGTGTWAANPNASGTYRGVPFSYTGGSPYRDDTFARRRLRDLRSALRLFRLVRGTRAQGPASVILFSHSAVWIVAAVLACRLARSFCVLEQCEYLAARAPDSVTTRARRWYYAKTMYRLVDGVIVISTFLEEHFSARIRDDARLIRVPILVDMDEFGEEQTGVLADQHTLVFVGHLNHTGEIDRLLDAFFEVAPRFPEWNLRVIGGTCIPTAIEGFRERAASSATPDRVEFVGSVERSALPGLLRDAGAFALPRATGLFSTAGFPTKLGEYLATGRPVVVTATGDIPLYLRDGVDAYVVPPDDTRAFAARLADVLADPAAAKAMGARGRETARTQFGIETQGMRLAAFMRGFGEPGTRRRARRSTAD